ncbi:J domain-containing protein [bacterium]|nr:J domain-containing protein [bacterium]
MQHDYYLILNISPDATVDTIKKAYRKQALKCHPDRGGSHTQMVLVNEAWLILSDPMTRKHYDFARIDKNNNFTQKTAQQDTQRCRQNAQNYPRKWTNFDQWFNSHYGVKSIYFGATIPTGGRSIVCWLFIVAGFCLGFLGGCLIWFYFTGGFEHGIIGSKLAMFLGIIGAWLGTLLHFEIIKKIQGKDERRSNNKQYENRRNHTNTNTNNLNTLASKPKQDNHDYTIFNCQQCNQKLRIPLKKEPLKITCTSCKSRFHFQYGKKICDLPPDTSVKNVSTPPSPNKPRSNNEQPQKPTIKQTKHTSNNNEGIFVGVLLCIVAVIFFINLVEYSDTSDQHSNYVANKSNNKPYPVNQCQNVENKQIKITYPSHKVIPTENYRASEKVKQEKNIDLVTGSNDNPQYSAKHSVNTARTAITAAKNTKVATQKKKAPKPKEQPQNLIVKGSSEDFVHKLQGKPDSITSHHTYEVWHYDYSSITISLKTHKVTGWCDTSGLLKISTVNNEKSYPFVR